MLHIYSCQHSDIDRKKLWFRSITHHYSQILAATFSCKVVPLIPCPFAAIPKSTRPNSSLTTNLTINKLFTLYTLTMKLASIILFSSSLLGMASAGYLIKSVPARVILRAKPRHSIFAKRGCDNSQCPPPPDLGCLTSTRHSIECGNGNDDCWIIPRDCASLCRCMYYNPYNDLLDSCARGVPGTDSYSCHCVFDCAPLGPKSGNGQCTASQDICKLP
ncbi:hypothetical protein COCMIDRAFT_40036 [Bipolaris oryzae ATCC 44560]|uniref:Uncharacterized protein n=1 Tax=Bipolaris oryzae ATCC 44560 TaxID=930090 RepID=W6YQW8_COCMI|nr:uncharacterized protein COCMIDRAFT_40036 [Bipolaris oryzae ATCC 44560]EUC41827.1 hypothetical protein COCMIDRAFT_40036 [Bipolaris oryzae ATCC 44560]